MLDQDNKENLKTPEGGIPEKEQAQRFEREPGKVPESPIEAKADRIVASELRKEIEAMQLDDNTKAQAEAKAEKIEFLGEKEKIEHLLRMARTRGLLFAIHMARKMKEPYLLDILHDTLAQEGFYKDFTK